MRKLLLAASFAVLAVTAATSASAGVSFVPGGSSASPGYTIIDTFDNADGLSALGPLVQLKTPPNDGNGAAPPQGSGSYLSVLGGGAVTYTFAAPVSSFEFDWGSIDTYNTLTLLTTGGSTVVHQGTDFITAADGNQVSPGTNGLFIAVADPGEKFTGFTMASGSNSFEIDNLAVASVPEPATWAMMLTGFFGLGAMLRSRRRGAMLAA